MQSSLYSISNTTIPEKRRRRTGKRDDRTQPKSVQPLPRRPDGTIALPVTIGRGTNEVIIYNIGMVTYSSLPSFLMNQPPHRRFLF